MLFTVAFLVNNVKIPNVGFLTNNEPRTHGNFDIAFEVTEGSIVKLTVQTRYAELYL